MCYPACGMVHILIKDFLLLVEKAAVFLYCLMGLTYVQCHITINVLDASLNKIFSSSYKYLNITGILYLLDCLCIYLVIIYSLIKV